MSIPFNFTEALLAARPSLKAFAVSLSRRRDKADDLVQETLYKALTHQDSFQPGTNLKAWLYAILRNEFYSLMRKRGREVEDVDGIYSSQLVHHGEQEGVLDLKDMRRALGRLSPHQREVLLTVGASGLSYEEAAIVSGVAVGTVKSRVNRARMRLMDLLGYTPVSDKKATLPPRLTSVQKKEVWRPSAPHIQPVTRHVLTKKKILRAGSGRIQVRVFTLNLTPASSPG